MEHKNKWPHPSESSFQAIEGAVKENDLSPYHYDDFKSVFWGAFIK